jgi:hypothetical protein
VENEADAVEDSVRSGLQRRCVAMAYLHETNYLAQDGYWNALKVREQIKQGLTAIKDAQAALTAFHQR